jgi:hypothetical protein
MSAQISAFSDCFRHVEFCFLEEVPRRRIALAQTATEVVRLGLD